MTASGWIQLLLYVGLLFAITKPMGLYLHWVLEGRKYGRIERLIYRFLRTDPEREHDWKQYGVAMFLFSLVTMAVTYAILRAQQWLPLNPQKLGNVADHLALNTAASFTTNTNWQNYGGESTMSYLSQMVALASHNFFSAAVGIVIAAVVVRGLCRNKATTIGNFWVDLVRVHLYLLLPICIAYATFLVSQGMIQNFRPYTAATGVDQSASQSIVQGPMASQIAIKMLGTNG
ncbi:MAG TPA: potassium-transporting ATPase subunit KdpA, partial [Tepidisphaeraceae bacterium]|nr:potassium-transporting ATPase subunit KdpA [Tepidisphaeraceae bacterium]